MTTTAHGRCGRSRLTRPSSPRSSVRRAVATLAGARSGSNGQPAAPPPGRERESRSRERRRMKNSSLTPLLALSLSRQRRRLRWARPDAHIGRTTGASLGPTRFSAGSAGGTGRRSRGSSPRRQLLQYGIASTTCGGSHIGLPTEVRTRTGGPGSARWRSRSAKAGGARSPENLVERRASSRNSGGSYGSSQMPCCTRPSPGLGGVTGSRSRRRPRARSARGPVSTCPWTMGNVTAAALYRPFATASAARACRRPRAISAPRPPAPARRARVVGVSETPRRSREGGGHCPVTAAPRGRCPPAPVRTAHRLLRLCRGTRGGDGRSRGRLVARRPARRRAPIVVGRRNGMLWLRRGRRRNGARTACAPWDRAS